MAVALKAEIDIRPVLQIGHGLSDAALEHAWRRALRKTGEWIRTHVARTLSSEIKVPQKVLKQRLYFFLRSMKQGKVWLGINPIEARRLGAARQTRRGVTVGRHRFDGAWTMKIRDPGGVYRRTGRWRIGKRHVVTNGPAGKEYWQNNVMVEAYEEVKFDWDEAGERAFRSVAARAQERLFEILAQELRYELSKLR